MEANLVNLTDFLIQPKTQFIIPVYQRNYDWNIVQCKQLLKDIYEVSQNPNLKSHFIGSIVFTHEGAYSSSQNKIKQLIIIDGQQRLTTITLLILALSQKAEQSQKEELANELLEDYIINKRFEEEKIKLRPVKKDDYALKSIINNEDLKDDFLYSKITENFNYFKSEIPESDIECLLNGLSKLVFVEISLERGKDDPQRIFESLNSTGLDLSEADLIRNYILMDITPEQQHKIYEKYWIQIEMMTLDNNSKQSNLSDFIRDYLTIKYRSIPNKKKVFESFKLKYKFTNIEQLEEILTDLKNFSNIYNKIINPEAESNEEIRKHLRFLNKIEINVSYPFLLEVYRDYVTNVLSEKDFLIVLEIIQSFVWRRIIMGLPPNALNKIFMRLYEDLDKDSYIKSLELTLVKKRGQQRFPTDEEVVAELRIKDIYSLQSKNKTYYLERLENYDNKEPVLIDGNDDITIEHILPQNPSLEWKRELSENLMELQQKYLHNIANLTLSGNNGELGNKSFIDKRDLPEKGYRDSKLFLNRYLSSLNKWTEDEILKRLEILTKRTLEIWKFPDIDYEYDETEEINIMDIEDASSKKIDYAIFDDKKYSNIHYVELLSQITNYLFQFDPNTFLSNEMKKKIKISSNKEDFSKSISVGQSYFIEGHGNANSILGRLKKILLIYGLSDEMFIKFQTQTTSD